MYLIKHRAKKIWAENVLNGHSTFTQSLDEARRFNNVSDAHTALQQLDEEHDYQIVQEVIK